ncbi:hypothetical protein OOZ51_00390 [Arthrobacter sp. MI7-26]|uniref:hypothetical protein n=1 Tax=Arthrobacter sp. MI7-26 TaxID=2993653 RepID=UPI002248BD13|nr:hypothetical protein [Arthrobacter sp. MI7-26]MCX2746271.1 hypothetical protein [Arthrobacter sp. MI7-26]
MERPHFHREARRHRIELQWLFRRDSLEYQQDLPPPTTSCKGGNELSGVEAFGGVGESPTPTVDLDSKSEESPEYVMARDAFLEAHRKIQVLMSWAVDITKPIAPDDEIPDQLRIVVQLLDTAEGRRELARWAAFFYSLFADADRFLSLVDGGEEPATEEWASAAAALDRSIDSLLRKLIRLPQAA